MGRRACAITLVGLLVLAAGSSPAAQGRPAPAIDVSVGWTGFADDGIVTETPVGGAVRWYITPRLSVGPEFTHIIGESHSHQVLTGNLTFEFVSPDRPGQVVPFLVAGGGLFRTSESFGQQSFNSNEGAFTAGGGVRYIVTRRVALGLDARVGWEPHVRVAGSVSVRLGGTP